MLIYPADRIREIEAAREFGIEAKISRVDFRLIMDRMKKTISNGQASLRKELKNTRNLDFYNEFVQFRGDYTLELAHDTIKGRKIFIASGSRPAVPKIKGLDTVDYMTNEGVLNLKMRPKSVIIIGGGYIGVEYAHFFSAIGSGVTILGKNEHLVPNEEPEVSMLLEKSLKRRMSVYINVNVTGVEKHGRDILVFAQDKKTRRHQTFAAERVLIAAGRVSNADLLRLENTGVDTDERNFVIVDKHLRTTKENIWAVGDIIGRQMFTHAGDKEAEIAWHNATHDDMNEMDFGAVPHVVFSHPQIASIGLTEEHARKKYDVLIGKARYSDIVSGDTMHEKEGFAKAIVDRKTRKLLGFHIIGPYASHIIQEAVHAMAGGADVASITSTMHAFPTLPEIIPEALGNLA